MADEKKTNADAEATEPKPTQRRARADVATDDAEQRHDETVPGGRYLTEDGRVVDANGEEID